MLYWCTHYKMGGVYDGMYPGPEDEHDKWLERKNKWKKNKGKNTSDNPLPNPDPNLMKLTLSNNLKASMVTNFNYTEADENKLWLEVVQNSAVN